MLDELEKDILAPLDVVEQANQRLLYGLGLEQFAKRPRDLIRRCSRRELGLAEHHLKRMACGPIGEKPGSARLLHDLHDRPVRDALAVGEAPSVHDGDVIEGAQELRHEACLSDARRSEHREQVARALTGDVVEGVAEHLQLPRSPDHGCARRACDATGRRSHRDQAVGIQRLRLALQLEPLDELDRNRIDEVLKRLGADEDVVRLSRLLQTSGDVDRISRRETLLGSGNHFAGVDSDPQRKPRPEVAFELLVQLRDPKAQLSRRSHRS